MPTRLVTIGSRTGLHARPAALFVAAATALSVPVSIAKGGGPSRNARSILAVLSLALLARDLDDEPADTSVAVAEG